jgi:hypothetical protein
VVKICHFSENQQSLMVSNPFSIAKHRDPSTMDFLKSGGISPKKPVSADGEMG